MLRLFASICIVTGCALPGLAQQPNAPKQEEKSPLLEKGSLGDVRKSLEQVFQFTFEGAKLQFDRKSWDAAAKDVKEDNPFGRLGRMEKRPAIESIFMQIRSAVGSNSWGSSSGGREREITFSGGKLSGRLHIRGESIRMLLDEPQAPHRSLELTINGTSSFRIQLSHPDGDLVLLSQAQNGRFTAVALVGGQTFTGRGESFVAFFKAHRREMETQVLPALGPLGVQPVPAPSSEKVRKAVVALLSRSPETLALGKKLVADLESNEFPVRQKATQQLSDRYAIYQDLIQERLKEKPSLEVAQRLEKLVAEHVDAGRISTALTALGLLQDAGYLISLLDPSSAEERATLVAQLEKTTGQKLGTDPAAWKDWAKKSLK
jgi:hypothetical protein